MSDKDDISISEAAQMLGLGIEQTRRYCLLGVLDACQYVPGGAWHISRASVERLQKGWQELDDGGRESESC